MRVSGATWWFSMHSYLLGLSFVSDGATDQVFFRMQSTHDGGLSLWTAPPLASAGHTVTPFVPVLVSMINAIRSILKEAISLVIAIITFPLRALRRLL